MEGERGVGMERRAMQGEKRDKKRERRRGHESQEVLKRVNSLKDSANLVIWRIIDIP